MRPTSPHPLRHGSASSLSSFATFSLGLVAALWQAQGAHAGKTALCDETYNLQSATQYVYTTTDPKDFGAAAVTELKTDLSDMKVYLDSAELQFLVGFEGACGAYTAKPLRFLLRQKADREFKLVNVQGYSVRMYDTNSPLAERDYGYWFAFTAKNPPASPDFGIGMPKDGDGPFTAWYGLSVVRDSTRNPTSGLWSGMTTRLVSYPNPDDSGHIASPFKDFWKDLSFDANHQGNLTVQLIRITYDSKPTSLRHQVSRAGKSRGVFMARQSGSSVHFKIQDKALTQASGPSPSGRNALMMMDLFDMLGHKVAQVHPTGHDYFWNGKTRGDRQAQRGVYFAEIDGNVVGKFMYSP